MPCSPLASFRLHNDTPSFPASQPTQQAAKSVGQTLRAFQPTIKEVVEVSQEIKGTLEQVGGGVEGCVMVWLCGCVIVL